MYLFLPKKAVYLLEKLPKYFTSTHLNKYQDDLPVLSFFLVNTTNKMKHKKYSYKKPCKCHFLGKYIRSGKVSTVSKGLSSFSDGNYF